MFSVLVIVIASFALSVKGAEKERLLSSRNQCGSWNNLADLDCTGHPNIKIQYTRDLHSVKSFLHSRNISVSTHLAALQNASYALATNNSYVLALSSVPDVEAFGAQGSQGEAEEGVDPFPVIPPSFRIPTTGWYQYTKSQGLQSATFLPQGLNTLIDGLPIKQWIACECARYSWGNGVAHTLVRDLHGYPLVYLTSNVAPPSSPPSRRDSYTHLRGAGAKADAPLSLTLPLWSNIPLGESPSPTGGSTYDADVNTGDFLITSASGGTVLTFSACGPTGATCGVGSSGDTFFRLVDPNNKILAEDDDSCGAVNGCSRLVYTVPGPSSVAPPLLFKVGCFGTWTCSAQVTITGIASLAPVPSSVPTASPSSAPTAAPSVLSSIAPTRSPTRAPSVAMTGSPSTYSSRAPTLTTTTLASFPVAVTGWYWYTAALGMSSGSYLPQGLDTPIDYGLTILQWTNCGCARFSWGNTQHTLINDVYGYPLAYLTANVPVSAPTVAPSRPSLRPSASPSRAPTPSRAPAFTPTLAPVSSKAPSSVALTYNLNYGGGKINPNSVVKLIFWGSSWSTNPGDKISGLDLFYKGYSGSTYANIQTQYTGTNGRVGNTITYQGYVIDATTPPTAIDSTTIFNEVCKTITTPDPSGNGYYVVYTERPRGTAGYCGWHTTGYCNGAWVQFGFIFNLDNDYGCTSGSGPANPGWQMSQGMHALAGVSAHELAEQITDPYPGQGWVDSAGWENGDKCAWTYPPALSTFSNGIKWNIQGEWSNSNAIAGTGYSTYSSSYSQYVNGCMG